MSSAAACAGSSSRTGLLRRATAQAEWRRGAVATLPALASYAPFAILVGIAVGNSRSPAAAGVGVWLIFAGTAQLVALKLTAAGSSIVVAAVSALVVNARLALYSATIAPHWRGTSLRSRLVAAATIIDPTWMLATHRFQEDGDSAAGRQYYGGSSAVMWFGWASLTALGAAVGNRIPSGYGVELLAPLVLLAMIGPRVHSWAGAGCVGAAATTAVVGAALPSGTALLIAMPVGAAAAAAVRRGGPVTTS